MNPAGMGKLTLTRGVQCPCQRLRQGLDDLSLTTRKGARLQQDRLPAAPEVFGRLPPAIPDDGGLRESIRAMRAADGQLLGVLDDDPTGSQAVRGVQVVTVLEEEVYQAAFGADPVCFVLTNTRSLAEPAAAQRVALAAGGLMAVAARRGARIQLLSRSDSTLRGHVMAEVAALQAVRRRVLGSGYDGVLLVPAFLEAGRLTAGDIHWARTGAGLVPVGRTEFARDPVFGYTASDLREFLTEKSGGAIRRGEVASIGLADIRGGGPSRVGELLAGVHGGRWVVVNATEYSDLETVAAGVLLAERGGQSFLFRTGPSFVRALGGLAPGAPLRGQQIRPRAGGGHGLVVVGSHVGQTSRQLAALRALGATADIELDVPSVLAGPDRVVADTARRVAVALGRSDVLLYTSRTLIRGRDPADSLAIARKVSAALSRTVLRALPAEPAWVIAKGGITSHDVALHGLGIRRAEVAGQLFPGVISVFCPIDAAPEAIGMPYIVFAGNVGGDQALTQVVAILHGEQQDPLSTQHCCPPRNKPVTTRSRPGRPRSVPAQRGLDLRGRGLESDDDAGRPDQVDLGAGITPAPAHVFTCASKNAAILRRVPCADADDSRRVIRARKPATLPGSPRHDGG